MGTYKRRFWPLEPLTDLQRSAVWDTARLLGVGIINGVGEHACGLLARYYGAKEREFISAIERGELDQNEVDEEIRKMQKKTPLLLVSCVQVAVKMDKVYHELTFKQVRAKLRTRGLHYSTEEVVASEFDVYRVLGFGMPIQKPAHVVEVLKYFGGEDNPQLPLVTQYAELMYLRGAKLAAELKRRLEEGESPAVKAAWRNAPNDMFAFVADNMLTALLDTSSDK